MTPVKRTDRLDSRVGVSHPGLTLRHRRVPVGPRLGAAVLAGWLAAPARSALAADTFTLQLLHFSDQQAGPETLNDISPFSSVLNALRAEYADRSLTVAAGNLFIPGPLFFARSMP